MFWTLQKGRVEIWHFWQIFNKLCLLFSSLEDAKSSWLLFLNHIVSPLCEYTVVELGYFDLYTLLENIAQAKTHAYSSHYAWKLELIFLTIDWTHEPQQTKAGENQNF